MPLNSPAISETLTLWQNRLLPFMTGFMAALAVLFFALSVYDMAQMRAALAGDHSVDIREQIRRQLTPSSAVIITPDQAMQQSLMLLEADALDKRYHQAGALLLSRVLTRHLAFMTGMVLSFLGASFILAKMSDMPTDLSGGAAEWKMQISTASPGIVLCVLGTVLMMTSLVISTPIDVRDGPVYVGGRPAVAPAGAPWGPIVPEPAGVPPMAGAAGAPRPVPPGLLPRPLDISAFDNPPGPMQSSPRGPGPKK